ncbi:YxiG-like protein [Streptomyces sp. NEAU-PBA10]|uniref:YxiG-like domain-containing protein n=1 Tax=Streptomyces tremellae TaxID=1124239 RepID=A0ABP7FUG9_9ACTN
METAELGRMLGGTSDHTVVHHGYTNYMCDYEVIVYAAADPRAGYVPCHLRYLFRHCVDARVETSESAVSPRGAHGHPIGGLDRDWGTKWRFSAAGARVLPEFWSRALGIDFHEVRLEANGHHLAVVFSDLVVSVVPSG